MKRRFFARTVLTVCSIVLGNAIYAYAVCAFIEPFALITGGVTGLSLLAQALWGWRVAVVALVLNLALLALGLVCLGRRFALRTVLSSLLLPLFLAVFPRFPQITDLGADLPLAAVFSGLVGGLGLGLVMRAGASTGGMDIPPLVLHRYTGWPVATLVAVFDLAVLVTQFSITGREQVLWGILSTLLMSISIEYVLQVGEPCLQAMVISTHNGELRTVLLEEGYGVTMLHMESGALARTGEMLLCTFHGRSLPEFRSLVTSADPNAFFTVHTVREVGGRGYTLRQVDLPLRTTGRHSSGEN